MVGRFPSLKMQRMVAFESLIEQDYLFLLDFEPAVLGYFEQPIQIEYIWEEKKHHYTPDFHVIRKTGEELVECKPQKMIDYDDNQRKFKIAREWCQNQGWRFQVVTDEEIRSGNRLNNIKLLTRHARVNFGSGIMQQAIFILQKVEYPQTLCRIAKLMLPEQYELGVSVLLNLAYYHHIQLELNDAPISTSTMIQSSEYIR